MDTNVGRICARLGWIPLDAEQAVEDMDDYAPEPEVHKYLHSRWVLVGHLFFSQGRSRQWSPWSTTSQILRSKSTTQSRSMGVGWLV